MGKIYLIEIFPKRFLKNKVYITDNKIIIILAEEDSIANAKDLLLKFLIEFARNLISEKSEYYSKKHGFVYNKIAIKEQSTRWGSCSSLKNLNFNWRLIFAPEKVLEYVIVHELSHTIQMNHSKAFWNLVEDTMPDYKNYRIWLKKNGKNLFKAFQL